MDTAADSSRETSLRDAFRLALIFAVCKLSIHIALSLWQSHLGYGFFRDEMYYIVCGRRLAWGYVDHGPLVALQARIAGILFGESLHGVRLLSAAAGAGRVGITGLLAWSLGGGRSAQGLAMTGVLAAPVFLLTDSFLSMNSAESLFWMTCLLALILIQRGGHSRWWLLLGLAAGLGLLNKPSMVFFLLAVLGALLLTRQHKLLATPWLLAAVAVILALTLPNLLWQAQRHWPLIEFLQNGRHANKTPRLPPLVFLTQQILVFDPLSMLLWGAGLLWLLRAREAKPWRWLGLTFLFFLAGMTALHAVYYYAAPIYPILFAAGGVAWERFFASRPLTLRRSAFLGMEAALLLLALVTLPWAVPVLGPEPWLRYMKATHLYALTVDPAGRAGNQLPLFLADQLPWAAEVALVTRAYNALNPQDRARAAILCANYGEASAVNVLGRGLPFAVSGSNNYFLWGPGGATGELLIAVSPQPPEVMARNYDAVEVVGTLDDAHTRAAEHVTVYLLRGRHKNLTTDWPNLKNYF